MIVLYCGSIRDDGVSEDDNHAILNYVPPFHAIGLLQAIRIHYRRIMPDPYIVLNYTIVQGNIVPDTSRETWIFPEVHIFGAVGIPNYAV